MRRTLLFICWTFQVILAILAEVNVPSPSIYESIVDFEDMGSYSHLTKSNIRPNLVSASSNLVDKECPIVACTPSVDDSLVTRYFKRIIAVLLNNMEIDKRVFGPEEAITVNLLAEISHKDYQILSRLIRDEDDFETNLHNVDRIFTGLIRTHEISQKTWFLEDLYSAQFIYDPKFLTSAAVFFIALMATIPIFLKMIRSSNCLSIFACLFVLIFIISCFWTHKKIVNTLKRKNHARLVQNSRIPLDCHLEDMSWMEWIGYSIRTTIAEDRCQQYYEAVLNDEFWEVSPGEVVSRTATIIIFSPLSHIGENIGHFFRTYMEVFPWWIAPVALLILILLIVVLNVKIQLPYLSVEPVWPIFFSNHLTNQFEAIDFNQVNEIRPKNCENTEAILAKDANVRIQTIPTLVKDICQVAQLSHRKSNKDTAATTSRYTSTTRNKTAVFDRKMKTNFRKALSSYAKQMRKQEAVSMKAAGTVSNIELEEENIDGENI